MIMRPLDVLYSVYLGTVLKIITKYGLNLNIIKKLYKKSTELIDIKQFTGLDKNIFLIASL